MLTANAINCVFQGFWQITPEMVWIFIPSGTLLISPHLDTLQGIPYSKAALHGKLPHRRDAEDAEIW
jgi:hypothetical protein